MSNPFDDDVDISSFYKTSKKNDAGKSATQTPDGSNDFNFYEQQIEQILRNTVDSSNRGVMMLEESEKIGIATAEDLVTQGEQLQKVNKQLEEINLTTKQSQKHLNNIKSIFGGIKNYFSKSIPESSTSAPASESSSADKKFNKLSSTVDKVNEQADRDYSGVGGLKGQSSLSESSRAALAGTRWESMNEQVDENLDLMSANLSRLRQLGSALGQEIDDQNVLLDKISGKAEKADVEIRHQDKQMKKILDGGGKKPKNTGGGGGDQNQQQQRQEPPRIVSKYK